MKPTSLKSICLQTQLRFSYHRRRRVAYKPSYDLPTNPATLQLSNEPPVVNTEEANETSKQAPRRLTHAPTNPGADEPSNTDGEARRIHAPILTNTLGFVVFDSLKIIYIKVDYHYFEEGNVQLDAKHECKDSGISVRKSAPAKGMFRRHSL
nr:hypothetical protein CFP56_17351 [Quercus suber]